MTPTLATVREWHCPACGLTDQTREARPHTRFHACPRLRGLESPMLPRGTAAKLEVNEREEYVGRELVQTDANGRPVMSLTITRDDGQDCVVFAPTAIGTAKE